MYNKISEILKGIDKVESESDDGWWETSTGAEFGAKKLKEILDLVYTDSWYVVGKPVILNTKTGKFKYIK